MHFLFLSTLVCPLPVICHLDVLNRKMGACAWSSNHIHWDEFHVNCKTNKWKMVFSVSMVPHLGRATTFSCRYGKNLSFANLVTPITVLGAERFSFPCNVFFWRTSAEEVLSMSRNQNWSLLRQNNSKSTWQVSNKFDL